MPDAVLGVCIYVTYAHMHALLLLGIELHVCMYIYALVVKVEPKASSMLGKHAITEL